MHEIKLDGWRLQIRMEDGAATLRTRNGRDYSSTFPEFGSDRPRLRQLHHRRRGVFCPEGRHHRLLRTPGRDEGRQDRRACFLRFDLLFLGDQDLRSSPLVARKKKLLELLSENKDQTTIRLAEHLDVAGADVLKAACNLKLEGIVSKRLSEPYVSGSTGIWTKAKCRATQHAVIGGWTTSPKGFSGLLLGVYKGENLILIGRVGTGFPQRLLRWLEPRLKQLETDVSPFSAPIPRKPGRTIHYAKPDLIAGFENDQLDQRWRDPSGIVAGSPRAHGQDAAARLDKPAGVSIGQRSLPGRRCRLLGEHPPPRYIFMGHPKGAGRVLVLAHSGDTGFEVDADGCSPTSWSNPQGGQSIASDISAIIRAG